MVNNRKPSFGWFLFFGLVFLVSLSSAAEILDELHLNIQTLDSGGGVITGSFDFDFNISTTADCNSVIYSKSDTLSTDSRGIISYYLENVSLDYDEQYYLCYYRDGSLIESAKISQSPYAYRAKEINLSGVSVDSNFDMSGYNLTADYIFGDGSMLTNLNVGELDLSDYYLQSVANSTFIFGSEENNLNVNSSTYWADLSGYVSRWFRNTAGQLDFNEELMNSTIDSKIAEGQSALAVNSTQYWDNLDSPADIKGSQIDNDLSWVELSELVSLVGNWSQDKGDYYTSSQVEGFGYYNLSSFDINDYYLASNPNNYLNETTLNISSVNYWIKEGSDLYYNGGNVGIGTTNPTQKLEVEGSTYINTTNGGMYIGNADYSGNDMLIVEEENSDNARAMSVSTTAIGSLTGTAYQGLNAFVTIDADATGTLSTTGFGGALRNRYVIRNVGNVSVSKASGVSALITNGNSDGSYTDAVNFNSEGISLTAGTVENHYSFYAEDGSVTGGTLNNNYGLYIEDMVYGNNRFGIYQVGTNDLNYFGGNVGIGTTSPQESLHVNGNVIINGTLNMDSGQINNLANGTASQDAVTYSQLQDVNSQLSGNVSDTYVPYTGAMQDVDLGSRNIGTTGNVSAENVDVADTLTISGMTIFKDTNGDMVFRA